MSKDSEAKGTDEGRGRGRGGEVIEMGGWVREKASRSVAGRVMACWERRFIEEEEITHHFIPIGSFFLKRNLGSPSEPRPAV